MLRSYIDVTDKEVVLFLGMLAKEALFRWFCPFWSPSRTITALDDAITPVNLSFEEYDEFIFKIGSRRSGFTEIENLQLKIPFLLFELSFILHFTADAQSNMTWGGEYNL